VAAHLDIPQVGFVKAVESCENQRLLVQRLMEDGYDRIEMGLPAVLTVVKDINTPRLPSLRGKRKAKKAEMKILNADDLKLKENDIGLNGSPTQVVSIFSPELKKGGEKHELPAEDLAKILYDKLKEIGK